ASSDTTLKSGNGDGTTPVIQIVSALSWASTSRLTLDAKKDIVVKAPVTVAGTGAVTITYDGGDLLFFGKGKLDFSDVTSRLIVKGNGYELVNDVKKLAIAVAKNPSGSFALAGDHDAAEDGRYKTSPIGTHFSGTFEGLSHEIANLTINSSGKDYFGLFASVDSGGVIRNLRLSKVRVFATKGQCVGAIAGCSNGSFQHVSVQGTVHGGDCVGGIVGTGGAILDANANVRVVASGGAGGFAGCETGPISFSRSTGSVTGGYAAGGLVGVGATIDQSFSTASVYGAVGSDYVGGLIGARAEITNSYATGNVHNGGYAGGAAGRLYSGDQIVSSYSTGEIRTGGVKGGFAGRGAGHGFKFDYWDIDTSGEVAGCGKKGCGGVTGLTDAQLKSGLPKGFDPKIWGSDPNINNGYPYLLANPPQ
ncbi:MAG: hypothetical protein JO056_08335, partial [Alphaproteobacteria bacterium]|nr:hypothetical protein [Alphaproteobacteria bacterium]